MRIKWTGKASSDLVRLHEHLRPVAPEAAARVVQQLSRAPDRLLDYPRIGEKLDAYELRYEIADATIFILRLWHCREERSFESDD